MIPELSTITKSGLKHQKLAEDGISYNGIFVVVMMESDVWAPDISK